MDNSLYLQQLGVYDLEARKRCLDAMQKYQSNHWWEPDVDLRTYGYYQLKEKTLLGNAQRFHGALEHLLGRAVYSHELELRYDALVLEAERAWRGEVIVSPHALHREE